MAIKIYRRVHTGANIQFGGLKIGLLIVWYQVLTPGVVTDDPKKAIKKVMANDANNFRYFFMICFY